MLSRVRRRLAGDAGLTLIEMLVAIVIIGVVLMGLASTLVASLISLHGDELRVRASQLANEVVEELKAGPWDEIGFYEDDPGYTAQVDGADTVTLGEQRDGAPGPVPTETIERGGIDYAVTTSITWVLGSGDGEERLKAFDVTIDWNERGSPRSHSVHATRAPTAEEVAVTVEEVPESFEITAFSIDPQPVELDSVDNTEVDIIIRATTSLAADETAPPEVSVELADGTTDSWSLVENEGADAEPGTAWMLRIDAPTGQFDPGEYTFVLTASADPPAIASDEATETVWFVHPSNEPMEIQPPQLDPAPFCRPQGSETGTYFDVTAQFDVHGASGADSATVKVEGGEEIVASSIEATAGGALFEATIPAGTDVKSNHATLVLSAYRTVDSAEATLSHTTTVEAENDQASCSGAQT